MLRPYFPGDLWLVVNDVRPEQVAESLSIGVTPEEGIRYGIAAGQVQTLELGGEVAGIVGVIQGNGYLVPWSVFNSVICKHPIAFLRECKRWISSYDAPMRNAVSSDDHTAIRWLEWLGFTVGESEPLGINGQMLRWYWRGS